MKDNLTWIIGDQTPGDKNNCERVLGYLCIATQFISTWIALCSFGYYSSRNSKQIENLSIEGCGKIILGFKGLLCQD